MSAVVCPEASWLARARVTAAVIGFAVVTALAAQVRVALPGTEVPMTLQTLVVLLCGFALPPVAAMASMVVYLGAGLAGLPVFAGGAGAAVLGGITGGYLLGFVPAAGAVSWLRGQQVSILRLALAGAAGTVIVFAMGAGWQAGSSGSPGAALAGGFLPFLPDAAVKLGLAVALTRAGAATVRRRRSAGS